MAKAHQNKGLTDFKERLARIGKGDNKAQTAQYITEIVLELRSLARGAELKTLSGALELAYYEAYSNAYNVQFPPAEVKRLRALEEAAKDMS